MNDDDLFKIVSKPIWNPSAITGMNPIVMVDALHDASSYTVANTSSPPPSIIAGKMISVVEEIDHQVWESRDPKQIKMAMVSKIAEQLITSKMVEFTSEQDPMNNKVKIRARLFVTPDDQVRILRKAGY